MECVWLQCLCKHALEGIIFSTYKESGCHSREDLEERERSNFFALCYCVAPALLSMPTVPRGARLSWALRSVSLLVLRREAPPAEETCLMNTDIHTKPFPHTWGMTISDIALIFPFQIQVWGFSVGVLWFSARTAGWGKLGDCLTRL